jgi:hypothetical protein
VHTVFEIYKLILLFQTVTYPSDRLACQENIYNFFFIYIYIYK